MHMNLKTNNMSKCSMLSGLTCWRVAGESVRESMMEDAEDSEWTYTANVDVTMGGTSSVCPEPCASVGGREGGRGREGERERGREGERERGGDGGVGARDARTCVSATVCV